MITVTKATSATPSQTARAVAKTVPVAPAAARSGAVENAPRARRPMTVTASSTATAATRPTPPVRLAVRSGRRITGSGNPDVVVLPGELAFLFGQARFLDRDDEAPVLADRTALDPGHDQVQFLELDAGNPDRRE